VALIYSTTDIFRKTTLRGQTRAGLVSFYDIRPGNGVGLFFQPRSPHRPLDQKSTAMLCL